MTMSADSVVDSGVLATDSYSLSDGRCCAEIDAAVIVPPALRRNESGEISTPVVRICQARWRQDPAAWASLHRLPAPVTQLAAVVVRRRVRLLDQEPDPSELG